MLWCSPGAHGAQLYGEKSSLPKWKITGEMWLPRRVIHAVVESLDIEKEGSPWTDWVWISAMLRLLLCELPVRMVDNVPHAVDCYCGTCG